MKRRRVRLVSNWRLILRYGWSVRLMFLAAILTGLEAINPLIGDLLPIPPGVLAVESFLIVVAAFVARFLYQRKLER